MIEPDISQYFEEFTPTRKQLKKLAKLLKSIHKSWGIDYGNSFIEATLVVAPGELSQLSPSAYDLLKRCQERIWEFRVRLDVRYDPFSKQTYEELFSLLVSLGLISDATPRQKLGGSKRVSDLQSLLRSKDLSPKGRKKELIDRLVENLTAEEMKSLVNGVILYRTTKAGDQALLTIKELYPRVQAAFHSAVIGKREYFEPKHQPLELAPGVLYDDGEVHITESDVRRALGRLESIAVIPEPIKENEAERIVLTNEAVRQLVGDIVASGNGWLTILTSDQDDSDFVQASFMETYPDRQWYCDASGNVDALATLGFTQGKNDPLPMKWISQNEIERVLLDTLRVVLGVNLGDTVWVRCEITG